MSASQLPRVAIGTRYMSGAMEWPDRTLPQFDLVTFEAAFETEWEFDAHFVTYDVPTLSAFPRLRKVGRALDDLRAEGHEVVQTMLALDYDNPGHAAWTPEGLVEFREQVEAAGSLEPLIVAWHCYYATKHGARFVYVLKEPVPVGKDSEAMHRSLVRAWGQRGIAIDPACSDWTRYFRLPKVQRE